MTNRKHFKVTFNGGHYNGAIRYYSTERGAIIAAKNYLRKCYREYNDGYCEVLYVDDDYRAKRIQTINMEDI